MYCRTVDVQIDQLGNNIITMYQCICIINDENAWVREHFKVYE